MAMLESVSLYILPLSNSLALLVNKTLTVECTISLNIGVQRFFATFTMFFDHFHNSILVHVIRERDYVSFLLFLEGSKNNKMQNFVIMCNVTVLNSSFVLGY